MQLSTRKELTSIAHQSSTAKDGYDEYYFGIYDIYEKMAIDLEDVRLIRKLPPVQIHAFQVAGAGIKIKGNVLTISGVELQFKSKVIRE
jgi:hypothetical protein